MSNFPVNPNLDKTLLDLQLISVATFAQILNTTRSALIQDVLRHPESYPRKYRIGTAKNSPYLFKKADIIEWIDEKKLEGLYDKTTKTVYVD